MKPRPTSASSFSPAKTSLKPHVQSSLPSPSALLQSKKIPVCQLMAFSVPRKPSPSSNSTTPYSSYEDGKSPVGAQSKVTSCLYLRPKGRDHEAATGRSFEKDVVLGRIRHRKRVNRIRGAVQSFSMPQLEQGEQREADGWLEDAFSSP